MGGAEEATFVAATAPAGSHVGLFQVGRAATMTDLAQQHASVNSQEKNEAYPPTSTIQVFSLNFPERDDVTNFAKDGPDLFLGQKG